MPIARTNSLPAALETAHTAPTPKVAPETRTAAPAAKTDSTHLSGKTESPTLATAGAASGAAGGAAGLFHAGAKYPLATMKTLGQKITENPGYALAALGGTAALATGVGMYASNEAEKKGKIEGARLAMQQASPQMQPTAGYY